MTLNDGCDKIYFMHTNARSLSPKIVSLLDLFEEFRLSFAIVTESWLASGTRLKEDLEDLESGTDLKLIYKNRPLRPSSRRSMAGGEWLLYITRTTATSKNAR